MVNPLPNDKSNALATGPANCTKKPNWSGPRIVSLT